MPSSQGSVCPIHRLWLVSTDRGGKNMTNLDRRISRAGSRKLSAAVSAALSMAGGAAAAQETVGLDEVIVTATRRAERLQDVSESISAFDANAISMRGLQQM